MRWRTQELRVRRVLAMQRIQNRIDIQRLKRPPRRQGATFMPDIERAIVEPDIRFHRHGAYGKRAVEGHIAPVVVVAVDSFLRFDGLAGAWVGGSKLLTGTIPWVRRVG